MKNILIITATDEEIEAIKAKFENLEQIRVKDLTCWKGKTNQRNYILTKAGIGKVNAARVTQLMIDTFETEHIINIGAAGAVNEQLEIGDIVIGEKLVQHDFDTTAFGDERGYITGVGKYFESNENLIKACSEVIENSRIDTKNIFGIIATGDMFCTKNEIKEYIRKEFNADCVEMEGAAIAQVCTLNKIPFLVIRSISDKLNGSNEIDYNEFAKLAAERVANFVLEI